MEIMKQKLLQRLEDLETEYESGQKMLAELETKAANLRTTLMQISGGIITLKRLIEEAEAESKNKRQLEEISKPEITSE